jgi:hypothetical protein
MKTPVTMSPTEAEVYALYLTQAGNSPFHWQLQLEVMKLDEAA